MSLINDALKRARQAQQENPPPPPSLEFKAADPAQRRSSGPPVLMIVAIVVVLAIVGAFIVIALQKREAVPTVANATELSVVAPEANSVPEQPPALAPVPTQSQSAPAAGSPASVVTGGSTDTATASGSSPVPANSASTESETSITNTAVVAIPSQPALPKLQGIFYRPTRPSAVVNGKNVYVGSRVGEFKVLSITQENVTIASVTETNVLSLAE